MLWSGLGLALAWGVVLYRLTQDWPFTRMRRRLPLRLKGPELVLVLLGWFFLQSFAVREDPFEFDAGDVTDWPTFLKVVAEGEKSLHSPSRRIWSLLSPDLQKAVLASQETEPPTPELESTLAASIQNMLKQKDFYRADDFANVNYLPEFRRILQASAGEVSERQMLRLNRGLLEASFPNLITPAVRQLLATVTLQSLLTLLLIPMGLYWIAKVPLYQLGIHGRHAGWYVAFGIVQWLIWVPVTIAITLVVRAYVHQETFHPALDFFSGPRSLGDWVLLTLSVAVVAPLIEELMFRGILQSWMVNRVGIPAGILITATLFGFAHSLSWPDPVPLIVLGFGMGVAYQRTRSLWPPVVVHALFNGMMLLAAASEMAG
ncbi:MAG: type II CAAX endopeptidase family protein [Planctomycetota bacterium]